MHSRSKGNEIEEGEGVVQSETSISCSVLDKNGPPLALMIRVWLVWVDIRL